jgi:tetratricopeptide (TPR) repeat protein
MWKLVLQIVILGGVFWAGHYVGQQPPGEVQHQLKTLSNDVMQKTLGVTQEELFQQHEFLEGKARILDSKSALLQGNYREAAQKLEEALFYIKKAVQRDPEMGEQLAQEWEEKIEELKQSLEAGKEVSQETLDYAQAEVDRLLGL